MVKKGRHRRYEEARKLKRRLAQSVSIEDIDLDADPWARPADERDEDDEFAELAAKYGALDDDEADDGDEED